MRFAPVLLLLSLLMQGGQTNKEQARAHYQIAIVALENKDMTVAARELRAAVRLDPENALLHFKLALVLREVDTSAADLSLKTALRLGLPEAEQAAARELGAQLAYAAMKQAEAAAAKQAANEKAASEAQALQEARNRFLGALTRAAGTWRGEYGDRQYKNRIEVKLRPTEQGATGSFACRSTDRGASWNKCESMECAVEGNVCRGRATSCTLFGRASSPASVEVSISSGGDVLFSTDGLVCPTKNLPLSR